MFIIFVYMKFLLLEKDIKIKKSFQKLLDNSYRIYDNSKNEEMVFKTEDFLLFRELNFQKTKKIYNISYYCYIFLDVNKPMFSSKKNVDYSYDLLKSLENNYFLASNKPFISNLRTDYDDLGNLCMMYIGVVINDLIEETKFKKTTSDIQNNLEYNILKYANKVKNNFENILEKKYFN
jgi:hypothetical protein